MYIIRPKWPRRKGWSQN